jgi:hypothetical protein
VEAQELAKSPPHRGRLIVFRKNQIDYPELQSVLEQSAHEEQGNQFDPPEPQPILEQPTHTEQVQNESTLPLQNAEEMESMAKNQVWDLVDLPKGDVAIGCK